MKKEKKIDWKLWGMVFLVAILPVILYILGLILLKYGFIEGTLPPPPP